MFSSARRRPLSRLAVCAAAFALSVTGLATVTAVPATAAPAPAKPRADVDGDDSPDYFRRSHNGSSTWWSNKTLAWQDYRFHGEPQTRPKDVIPLGHVRGDWRPEWLQLSHDGRLSLHTATTTGTQAPSWTGSGWQIYNRVTATTDLTGDGRPDVVARTFSGDLYLYRATGSATGEPFAGRVRIGPGWQIYDQLLGAGDLDRDGKGDLLARSRDGKLYYYQGTGSAAAPFKTRKLVGGGWNIYSKIFAEGNRDWRGAQDDIVGIDARTARPYEYGSKGYGVFFPREEWHENWWDADLVVGQGTTPVYGKAGITGVDAEGRLWSHYNRSDGFWGTYGYGGGTEPIPFPRDARLVVATGVDATGQATAYAFRNGTLTHVTRKTNVPGDFSATNLVVGPGDLTGDGKGDLLTRDTSGKLWLRAGRGDGLGFNAPTAVGTGWGTYTAVAGGGDITGDGRPDLVSRDGSGNLHLYPGTGSAAQPFGARQLVGGGWNGYNAIAVTGDQNGDGRADLVARDSSGTMWVYRGTGGSGSAAFAARQSLGKGWNTYGDAWPSYTQVG
ncbi:FG-GAP repeat domain-containing protein [Streptomyces sp. NPDC048603]|uniref:FG-GAP repeat domain-containing protein n=1 Tax=Streptomyces sp. NPDC048603 TaxID=3365577 RepID=UPI003714451E